MLEWIETWRSLDAPWKSAAIAVGSLLLAWISKVLFTSVLPWFARRTRSNLDDQILLPLRVPVFVSVLAFGLAGSLTVLSENERLHFVVFGLARTISILVWMVGLGRAARVLLEWLQSQKDRLRIVQPRTLPLFEIVAKTVLYGGGLYVLFISWGIDLTAWLASAGIVGVAVGFAAKDSLANLFAGIFILADAPYKIGDYVVLGTGERGYVADIGVRSTRILTRDDIQIIVPNGVIAGSKVVNESAGPHEKERVRVTVPVAYGTDLDRVRACLMEEIGRCDYIVDDPEPRLRLREFGDSGLIFQLMGWIERPALRGRAIDDLLSRVYRRLGEEGIEIPYAKRDLYIKEMPPSDRASNS